MGLLTRPAGAAATALSLLVVCAAASPATCGRGSSCAARDQHGAPFLRKDSDAVGLHPFPRCAPGGLAPRTASPPAFRLRN